MNELKRLILNGIILHLCDFYTSFQQNHRNNVSKTLNQTKENQINWT